MAQNTKGHRALLVSPVFNFLQHLRGNEQFSLDEFIHIIITDCIHSDATYPNRSYLNLDLQILICLVGGLIGCQNALSNNVYFIRIMDPKANTVPMNMAEGRVLGVTRRVCKMLPTAPTILPQANPAAPPCNFRVQLVCEDR